MSNVSYHIDRIENGLAYISETFDLTDPNGPGVLVLGGKIVDVKREGITSATRRVMMTCEQARQLGLMV